MRIMFRKFFPLVNKYLLDVYSMSDINLLVVLKLWGSSNSSRT